MSFVDDEVDCTDLHEVDKNNFQQIKNKAIKIGYADGVNDGRESTFQKGFDYGYKDGFRTSFNLEKFRFFFKNLNTDKINTPDLIKEKNEYDKLGIIESTSQKHFKYPNHPEESLDTISDRQQKYVDEVTQTFTQTLPRANCLLKVQANLGFTQKS